MKTLAPVHLFMPLRIGREIYVDVCWDGTCRVFCGEQGLHLFIRWGHSPCPFPSSVGRAITLSSFVSSLDRFYSALIPLGTCCHNFIGFMVAAESLR